MNKKLLTIFSLIFFVIVVLGVIVMAVIALNSRTAFFSQAKSSRSDSLISSENSYLFASPLQALAGGNEKIRLTIFILNSNGLGVSGKKVDLVADPSINIEEAQAVTDSYGKAIFDISSSNSGNYTIGASVESNSLPQRVQVVFR